MFSHIDSRPAPAGEPLGPERARYGRILFVMVVVAVILRIVLAMRPGLWGDEIFSLAMATGHSLEHPAASADPALGDFVEPREALSPAAWRAYMGHDDPAAGPVRVVRAVFLSDSSPPLYYLLLSGWTRLVGTSDTALRLFSAFFAIASLPLFWAVARATIGRSGAAYATFLFAFAPLSVYYSTEVRMYSLGIFLALLLAWASINVERTDGYRWPIIWAAIGGAALLTHYFLSFVWAACVLWLIAGPGRGQRVRAIAAAVSSLALVLPWYLRIRASLENWRVTAGWLDEPISVGRLMKAPPYLTWEMLSPSGLWGGSRGVNLVVAASFGVIILLALARGALRGLFDRDRLLPLLWLCAALGGLIVFDVLQSTRTTEYVRYALPGIPAAMLLGGYLCARIPKRAAIVLLAIIAVPWSVGISQMLTRPARWLHPYPDIAARLSSDLSSDDLIIAHSIPSGVLGVARYMTEEVPIASWVSPLGLRDVADDMPLLLTEARCTIALVQIHALDDSPAMQWLEENAVRLGGGVFQETGAELRTYRPPSAPEECD